MKAFSTFYYKQANFIINFILTTTQKKFFSNTGLQLGWSLG